MEWEPAASELLVKVVWALPLREPVPRVVNPSLKVTVPVGVPPLPLTVAVKTTCWPKTKLVFEEATVVVVAVRWAANALPAPASMTANRARRQRRYLFTNPVAQVILV